MPADRLDDLVLIEEMLSQVHSGEQVSRSKIVGRCQEKAAGYLSSLQKPDGHWVAELEGDCILESEFILLMAFLGRENDPKCLAAAQYLLEHQNSEGGWAQFPGGPSEISGSIKAYFALKITGLAATDSRMEMARLRCLALGGVTSCNSFTKFYLALLGQLDYQSIPMVPPEILLLPKWFYINLSAMSAWTRTIIVPLSIMSALKPVRKLAPEQGIQELFTGNPLEITPPAVWDKKNYTWRNFFLVVDRCFKAIEPCLGGIRSTAIDRAASWMRERFENSDGLGAIFPPMIYTVVALKALGVTDSDPELIWALKQIEDLQLVSNGHLKLQPCLSPVWDTALALNALALCGHTVAEPEVQRATQWLLSKEVRRKGDWAENVEGVEPGGWFFEYHNDFYPDTDDTAMVLMALARTKGHLSPEGKSACKRGIRWLLAMQNSDGGWAAFDKDINREILTKVPFADHNAMLDPSCADITARILEALAEFGFTKSHPASVRALEFLAKNQFPDGSWYGRWGVNHIYGTWQVLVGLEKIGIQADDPMVKRGADWLVRVQKADGSWGENCSTYDDPSSVGLGESSPSQTAWAILGLQAAQQKGTSFHGTINRGIDWLIRHQDTEGGWPEPQFTGTGFPKVFYLRYHYYRLYFPLMAIARYALESGYPVRHGFGNHVFLGPVLLRSGDLADWGKNCP